MYAFVHIEKTAGSTLVTILRRWFGTGHCDIRLPLAKRQADCHDQRAVIDAADLRRVRRLYRHLRGISGHNVKVYSDLAVECSDIQFFTVLRDPVPRYLSHYLNRSERHTREAFERWLDEPWTHNWQTKMIAGEASADKAIDLLTTRFGFVGLTERFDESLVMLGQWLGENGFPMAYHSVNRLSEKNRSRDVARKKTDLSYLELDSVRTGLLTVNAVDQKVYDFVTSTIYRQQLAAFRGNLEAEVADLRRRNSQAARLPEPPGGRLFRNWVYKPLLHCRAV